MEWELELSNSGDRISFSKFLERNLQTSGERQDVGRLRVKSPPSLKRKNLLPSVFAASSTFLINLKIVSWAGEVAQSGK